jgi:hypothetical protein
MHPDNSQRHVRDQSPDSMRAHRSVQDSGVLMSPRCHGCALKSARLCGRQQRVVLPDNDHFVGPAWLPDLGNGRLLRDYVEYMIGHRHGRHWRLNTRSAGTDGRAC